MIGSFTFENLPCRVVFGSGTLSAAAEEVQRLGGQARIGPHHTAAGSARRQARILIGLTVRRHLFGATMHTPVEVTEQALAAMKACNADCLVSLGGGSTTGLGKALALRTGVNQLCIPTTYAGSEMTPHPRGDQGRPEDHSPHQRRVPETVIYDVELTLSLPASSRRDLRHQRHRACGGSPLCARPESRDLADGRGRHSRVGRSPARHHRKAR